MKHWLLASATALLAFPVHARVEPMWMLHATVCLQFDENNAECRKGRWGPYTALKECLVRGNILLADTTEQAEADGAKVLFLAAHCNQGKDT